MKESIDQNDNLGGRNPSTRQVFIMVACVLFIIMSADTIAEQSRNIDKICDAIANKNLVGFDYKGEYRLIEPHQLAYNLANCLVLSAHWVGGYSNSGDTINRWRSYRIDKMESVIIMKEKFTGSRSGYKRTPNKLFKNAVCQL